ncbi:DinB family protein [Chryseolinea sp. T2]|uniref:DinB family protein n=1 Tax=Chryseolinea sp. T2 TaxID=3129255 RepID=UPI003077AA86
MATIISTLQKSMESEHAATRKCVERIPVTTYEFKPHPKSMLMGYLVYLVCDIPNWLKHIMDDDKIDLATFRKEQPKTTEEMVKYLDNNVASAVEAFKRLKEDRLALPFSLVAGPQLLSTTPRLDNITSTINHWVHHRGQLTVYMRLCDIPVPSIYGPSADDNPWKQS